MNIIIGADIVPTKRNMQLFENADVDKLVDDKLKDILNTASFRMFNLEVPLVDKETPIDKCGPALIASTNSCAGIKKLGIDFLTLANNHIFDQGENGLFSTMETLNKYQIKFAGVGKNIDEASKAFIFENDNKKIGVYCCAEHEFSIINKNHAGANPFDPLESLDHIFKLKQDCDYVIVLYHGGKEHYRYPAPYLQKVCRKMVEKGADLVICQHTHSIGCEEKYLNGTIVYGQGNFLFDDDDIAECWNTSLLVNIKDDFKIEYIPIVKNGNAVKLAIEEKDAILNDFYKRSEEIKDEDFIINKYRELGEECSKYYFDKLQGTRYKSFLMRGLNKLSARRLMPWIYKRQYEKKENLAELINLFECEAQYDFFVNILKSKFKNGD